MGRAARTLHDPGNNGSIERGSDLQAACRGSLTTPAKPAGEHENHDALTPRPGIRSPAQQPSRAVPIEIVTVGREETPEIGLEMSIPKLSVPYRVAAFPIPSSIPLHDVPADLMGELSTRSQQSKDQCMKTKSLFGCDRYGDYNGLGTVSKRQSRAVSPVQ